MNFFKIDLQEDAWLDQVFLSRNQAYGAFQIRKSYSQSSLYGLGLALLSFTALLSLPLFLKAMDGTSNSALPTEIMHLRDIKLPDIKKPPLVIADPAPIKRPTVRFVPPVIVPNNQADKDKTPPAIQDIQNRNIGSTNIEGKDSNNFTIPENPGTGSLVEKPNPNIITSNPEEPAEYPGGYSALSADISQYLKNHYPPEAIDQGISGKVFLNFVVEKDGSIDQIVVVRGKELGGGLSEVAVEAVSQLKKFHPGRQNGHAVRQYFNFPITFQIQNNE
jgi:protein TonB